MGLRTNERIRAREIRVVDDENNQLGVMNPREALELARSRGFDLIEVAPMATPPVCRIMDYGKYKYEQGKRERETRQKQRQSEMKGMALEPNIDDHDLQVKIKNVVKFLADGDKVKITVRFRSRWLSHPEFAQAVLQKVVNASVEAGVGQVERPAVLEGRQMILILSPVRDAAKKATPTKEKGAPKEKTPRVATTPTDAPLATIADAAPPVEEEAPSSEAPAPQETPEPIQVTEAEAETVEAPPVPTE